MPLTLGETVYVRALHNIYGDSDHWTGAHNEIVRPLRFRSEIAAMRADTARHLARQVTRVERLLDQAPGESLTPDELLPVDELVDEIKRLALNY